MTPGARCYRCLLLGCAAALWVFAGGGSGALAADGGGTGTGSNPDPGHPAGSRAPVGAWIDDMRFTPGETEVLRDAIAATGKMVGRD